MKKAKGKKQIPEFEGKSRDYRDGWEEAEEYFDYLLKGGNRLGSALYRIFVEIVAESMREKKKICQEQEELLKFILKWSDSEFNRGVYDLLVKKVREYRGVALIDEVIKSETGGILNEVPEM